MKKILKIKVYPSDLSKSPLLERMIPIEDNVLVDYESLFKSLRFLFPDNSVITIQYV